MEQVFSYIIGMGAAVMMPIIFTILGVCIGIKFSKALKSGLLVGVGFVGLSVVTSLLTSTLGPALSKVVEIYDLQLKVFDMGWPAAASVAYNTSVGAFIIPVCLGVNILMLLKYADHPMTQKELSERLLVDKSNLTGLVDRMSSAGHLQRVKSPEDRRSFRLQLTPEAEALLEELERPYLELLHSILGDFSEDELLTLLRTMNKLQRALDNRCAFAAANLSDNDN